MSDSPHDDSFADSFDSKENIEPNTFFYEKGPSQPHDKIFNTTLSSFHSSQSRPHNLERLPISTRSNFNNDLKSSNRHLENGSARNRYAHDSLNIDLADQEDLLSSEERELELEMESQRLMSKRAEVVIEDQVQPEPTLQLMKSMRGMILDNARPVAVEVEEKTPSFYHAASNENNRLTLSAMNAVDKLTEKSDTISDGSIVSLHDSLRNYHQAFVQATESLPPEAIANYEVLESINKQAVEVLSKEEDDNEEEEEEEEKPIGNNEPIIVEESSLEEAFDYIDAKEFYEKGRSHLKRSSSLKNLNKACHGQDAEMTFSKYYQRYLIPLREKIQEYAEKINDLVKEKELEFHYQNQVIQRLISEFSSERQQLEAELLDKNLLISKLRESNTYEDQDEEPQNFSFEKNKSHLDLPRQFNIQIAKAKALTPEKLYSFRPLSDQKSRNRSTPKAQTPQLSMSPHQRGRYFLVKSPKMLSLSNIEEDKIRESTSVFKQSVPLKFTKRELGDAANQPRDLGDLSRDLVNISQINFETQGDDLSMTNNNLFIDKPTSRFMDYGENGQRQSRGAFTQPLEQNVRKWSGKEESMYCRQGDLSLTNPELELVRSMNENLFEKLVRNDTEKSRMLEFIEKLVFEKKEGAGSKDSFRQQQAELDQVIEAINEEKARIEEEKQKIEEDKAALQAEREALTKKKQSLKEILRNIKSKTAKELAEKDLQLLLMDKKIQSKKKVIEEEWFKVDMMRKEVVRAQDSVSAEWRKINAEVEELDKLYKNYEEQREELQQEKKKLEADHEAKMNEIEKMRKKIADDEKRLRNEQRTLNRQREQLAQEKEEICTEETELEEKKAMFARQRNDFESLREKRDQKFGSIDAKLRAIANKIKKDPL